MSEKHPIDIDISSFNAEITGRMTFHYAVKALYNKGLSSRWRANSTKAQYNNEFNNILFPNITDKEPLEKLSKEYFDSVIEIISDKYYTQNNKHLSESRINHFKYLIRKVVATAADNGICDDYLWGTKYTTDEDDPGDTDKKDAILKTTQKSLTPKQELDIYNQVMISPTQSGQKIGLAIMFCCGVRNEEACGLNYEDLIENSEYKGYYCLRIYKTTYQYSNDLRDKGKTSNAYRIIPIPSSLSKLLLARKRHLEHLCCLGKVSCPSEKLPIVCVGNEFENRCISNHLSAAGRQLFKDIKADEKLLQAAEDELLELDSYNIDQNDEVIKKKEATTYLLRRNFATHLLILGLSNAEIQYIMGHQIEDPSFNRNDLNNPDKLYVIAQKLNKRALVGCSSDINSELPITSGKPFEIDSKTKFDFDVTSEMYLQLNTNEPNDELTIRFLKSPETVIEGNYSVIPLDEDYDNNVNVLVEYHNAYKKYENQKKSLQQLLE